MLVKMHIHWPTVIKSIRTVLWAVFVGSSVGNFVGSYAKIFVGSFAGSYEKIFVGIFVNSFLSVL